MFVVLSKSKHIELGTVNIAIIDNLSSCLRLITNYMKSDSVVSCCSHICKLVV